MTPAQTERSITDIIRSRSFAYVETTIPAGMTVSDYRRSRIPAPRGILARMVSRYPDDPIGDYETTDGGW